jgi:large subunit ribosomal protein L29
MEAKELRNSTVQELKDKLVKEKAALLNLRLERSMGALKNPYALRIQRKVIARINTLIKEKS